MSWALVTDTLRVMAISILLLLGIMLFRVRRRDQHVYLSLAFSAALISYLIVDWPPTWQSPLAYFLLAGAFAIPMLLWLVARALFEDHFALRGRHFILLAGVVLVDYGIYFLKTSALATTNSLAKALGGFLPQALSLVFVMMAAFSAYAGRKDDLIEARTRFRMHFIILTAGLASLTLLAEIALHQTASPEPLEFLHKLAILSVTGYFAAHNLEFRAGFFIAQPDPVPAVEPLPAELMSKLQKLLEQDKVYREEGLTITALAKKLGEKEYKARRLINRHMGFRNFNDFLNQYRVQEACEILLDSGRADLTILEIAYHLGYQSLGPFNSAFKRQTGLTPTAYRKSHARG